MTDRMVVLAACLALVWATAVASCSSGRAERRSATISAAESSGAEPAHEPDAGVALPDAGVVPADGGVAPLPLPDAGAPIPLAAR